MCDTVFANLLHFFLEVWPPIWRQIEKLQGCSVFCNCCNYKPSTRHGYLLRNTDILAMRGINITFPSWSMISAEENIFQSFVAKPSKMPSFPDRNISTSASVILRLQMMPGIKNHRSVSSQCRSYRCSLCMSLPSYRHIMDISRQGCGCRNTSTLPLMMANLARKDCRLCFSWSVHPFDGLYQLSA